MKGKTFFVLISLILCGVTTSYGQFTTGAGYELSFLKTKEVYVYGLQVFNKNETSDLYRVQNEIGVASHGFCIRSFGNQFTNPKKVTLGYSLGLGYRTFSSRSKLNYRASSTTYQDSIVNDYDGFEFKIRYHMIRFDHFFDIHWNPNSTIKITNSIGVGLSAIVKASSPDLGFDGTVINTNHPILRLLYQPQVTEKYERFSMTYFASVELVAFSLFNKPGIYDMPDLRIPLSKLRFNTIGIRISPHVKEKKKEELSREDY